MRRILISSEIESTDDDFAGSNELQKNDPLEVTMKIILKTILPLFATSLVLGVPSPSLSLQDPSQTESGASPRQQDAQDLIAQLNLTPEQREKIRAIRQETKNERAAINQRVKQANLALQQALESDSPDEVLVEQRLRDAAAAQADATRMRVLTEVRIRRVLTREQLGTLRLLRQQAAAARREQRMENQGSRRPGIDGVQPNQRNGMAPLFPRRGNATRFPRP
jgi:Spy/CpxP family protein refolding chaperone